MPTVSADRPGVDRPDAPSGEVRLYEKWRKIYPKWVAGRWQAMRRVVLALLLVVFYVTPWLSWNGVPLVWLDLPHRKFHLFGAVFWPQEFVLLSWLLMLAAFSLFFVTVFAGRVWCGWACPQTVWTLVYVWLEKWIEGDRTQRMRLDRGPWNLRRIRLKALKWFCWALLALSISFTLVAYFEPAREWGAKVASLDLGRTEWFWLAFPALLTFLFQGVLREQVCFHMCPYARFQSVMFDRDTLIIGYDTERGEPRGSRSRTTDPETAGLGSCVDCGLCVHVCPTGIDIRDGLQYQCIACAACIDVCDSVMDRMGYARGLIRYSSENRIEKKQAAKLRPRLWGYGAMLAAMAAILIVSLWNRVPLDIDVIRDRNRLYREFWDGSVENVYTLKVMNRETRDRVYQIGVEGNFPLELDTGLASNRVEVAAGGQVSVPARVRVRSWKLPDPQQPIRFTVTTVDDPRVEAGEPSRFVHPDESS